MGKQTKQRTHKKRVKLRRRRTLKKKSNHSQKGGGEDIFNLLDLEREYRTQELQDEKETVEAEIEKIRDCVG